MQTRSKHNRIKPDEKYENAGKVMSSEVTQLDWHNRYGFTSPALSVHAPGDFKEEREWTDMVVQFMSDRELESNGRPCPELSIVTWSNYDGPQLLERCLGYRGIEYTVLRPGPGFWSLFFKITLTRDWLQSGHGSSYILLLDCNDVLVFGQPDEIVSRFELMGCDVLLGTTPWDHPSVGPYFDFENRVYSEADPRWRHINSGGILARRDALLGYLGEIIATQGDYWYTEDGETWQDDQYAWREMHLRHHPAILVDTTAQVFSRIDTR
jgi:hypothetical protein